MSMGNSSEQMVFHLAASLILVFMSRVFPGQRLYKGESSNDTSKWSK